MSFFISDAMAQGAPAQQADPLMSFLPLILLFVVFYFLLIRPQQRKMKDHRALIDSLKRGDQVLTSGGIFGKITGLSEWVHYCDYTQANRLWNNIGPKPWYKRPFTPGFAEWVGVQYGLAVTNGGAALQAAVAATGAGPGDEVICERTSHIVTAEGASRSRGTAATAAPRTARASGRSPPSSPSSSCRGPSSCCRVR